MCPSKLKFGTQGLGLYFYAVVSCPLFRVVGARHRVYKRCVRLARTLERANSVEPFKEPKAEGREKKIKGNKSLMMALLISSEYDNIENICYLSYFLILPGVFPVQSTFNSFIYLSQQLPWARMLQGGAGNALSDSLRDKPIEMSINSSWAKELNLAAWSQDRMGHIWVRKLGTERNRFVMQLVMPNFLRLACLSSPGGFSEARDL